MKRVLDGIFSGISSTSLVYESAKYPSLPSSDLDRIRGDVSRIGQDFFKVIEKNDQRKSGKQ